MTPNPKTSECQRAGHKKGGAGGHPPRLFASGLSLEKAWIPRPGPGGNPRCRSGPAPVQTRTTYQGQPGAAYPLGGASEAALGRSAPGAPPTPAGVPISPEKWGERGPGASVIGRWLRWNRCRVDPATWVPRRLRRGSPAFFGRKPEERTPGASPWTPGFDSRSFPLAGFCISFLW